MTNAPLPDRRFYIFDLDGTLVDSMPTWQQNILQLPKAYGIACPPTLVRTLAPMNDRKISEYLAYQLGVPLPPEEIRREMRRLADDAYAHQIPAKKTVPETLRALRSAGCRLYVLTASPHCMLDVCLRRLGLYDLFDAVWSCDDFDAVKTDRRIYKQVAAAIGVPAAACVFVDDNPEVLRTAAAAGMATVGVFDETGADHQDTLRAVAGRYIRTLSELLEPSGG